MSTTGQVGLHSSLSIRSGIHGLSELLKSQQFWDSVRVLAMGALTGAAISASKGISDAILEALKQLIFVNATFRGKDQAHKWVMHHLTHHTDLLSQPRDVEVRTRPEVILSGHGAEEDYAPARDASNASESVSGVWFFPNESLHFKFRGTHVWVKRSRALVGDSEWDETLHLSFLTLSSSPLRDFIRHVKEQYVDQELGRCIVWQLDRYGQWTESNSSSKRLAESLHLPVGQKEALLDDVRWFLSSETRRWYHDRGIPWRRGYLFQGIPGSGKSSMVHVMASELSMHIYSISLSNNKIDDATFQELAQKVPERSILLLEDVDVAFQSREEKQTGVTLSSLLNAIDGVGATDGRILVLSTNRKQVLDEALIRPGRVDYELAFTYATSSQAHELFQRWYKPPTRRVDSASSSIAQPPSEKASPNRRDLDELAQSFAKGVPDGRVSVAALQGHLLKYPYEPTKAVQTLAAWLVEQRRKDDA